MKKIIYSLFTAIAISGLAVTIVLSAAVPPRPVETQSAIILVLPGIANVGRVYQVRNDAGTLYRMTNAQREPSVNDILLYLARQVTNLQARVAVLEAR